MIASDCDSDYAKCFKFSAEYYSALRDRLQVRFILAVKLKEKFDSLMSLFNNRAVGPFNTSKFS